MKILLLPFLLDVIFVVLPPVHSVGVEIEEIGKGKSRSGGAPFCYEKPECRQGTAGAAWEVETCAKGRRQSPIDLPLQLKQSTTKCALIKIESRYRFSKYQIKNDGHTLKVTPTETAQFKHFQNPKKYKLAQFHFHWGPRSDFGSEHTLSGRAYAMELHLVHHSTKYNDLGAAVKSSDGDALAVIGLFLEVSTDATDSILKNLVTKISSVKEIGEKDIDGGGDVDLSSAFDVNKEAFVYDGSLTTPGCDEKVLWVVMKTPILVLESEVAAFRTLKNPDKEPQMMNYRKIQDLNDRKVGLVQVKA